MELPNNVKLCEQVFLVQLKPHCIKYAEKHRVFKNDMLKLQEFFKPCHSADVTGANFTKIMEGKKKAKENDKAKKPSCLDKNKPSDRVDH
jgi:hypothetical protein